MKLNDTTHALPAEEPLLVAQDVSIEYDTETSRVLAVHKVSFRVERGDTLMILGHSGCGKSTLLKAIAGYLPIASGSLKLNGEKIASPGPDRMVVWQESDQLLPWLNVQENVAYAMKLNGVPKAQAQERAQAILEKVGLKRALNSFPHELSGGMKMRVAIARGLAMRPAILLMDEPFSALDALSRSELQDEILRLKESTDTTIVFVTHDISEAVKLGTQLLILSPHPGQVLARLDASRYSTKLDLADEVERLIRQSAPIAA